MNVSNLAFYIGKTSNRNVAIYRFNMVGDDDHKSIDLFNPLHVYWIMREKDGNPTEELTTLEKTIGYGYDFLDTQENSSDIKIRIKALPTETITIKYVGNKYKCTIPIHSLNGSVRDCHLKKIFLHNSGPLNYNIDSVDIIYEDPDTGKLTTYTKTRPSSGWDNESVISQHGGTL